MKFNELEHKAEALPIKKESVDRLRLVNEINLELQSLSDFELDTADGRDGFKLALVKVFDGIEKIEGLQVLVDEESGEVATDKEYEVTDKSIIRARIRDTYKQLYDVSFHEDGSDEEKEEFYSDIEAIREMIEDRGKRFIEDMPEYKNWNEEKMAA